MTAIETLHKLITDAAATGKPLTLSPRRLSELTAAGSGLDVLKEEVREEMMDVRQVCATLRITRQTLWGMRRSGQFIAPVALGGRRLLFRRSDFNAWLAALPKA